MGSSGSGRLTDYPGSSKTKQSGGSGGSGAGGGDRCSKAINVDLEDIEHCDFFKKHNAVPAVGTILEIAITKRIVAQTHKGEVVGHLPTKFNYLADCLNAGFSYVGKVRSSKNGPPTAAVNADFAPV